MTIRTRLFLGIGVLMLFTIVPLALVFYVGMRTESRVIQLINAHDASSTITNMAVQAQKLRRYEKEYFIYVNDDAKRKKYSGEWQDAHDKLKNSLIAVSTGLDPAWNMEDIGKARQWDGYLNSYARGFIRVDASVDQGLLRDTIGANKAIQDAKNAFRPFFKGTGTEIESKLTQARRVRDQILTDFTNIKWVLGAMLLVAVVVALILIFYLPASIANPLKRLTQSAIDMSRGNLNQRIDTSGIPEVAELSSSVERLRVAMKGLLMRVNVAAGRSNNGGEASRVQQPASSSNYDYN